MGWYIDKKIEKLVVECLINLCVNFFTMCVYVLGAFAIFDNSLYKLGCHFKFYGELFDPFTQLLGEKKLARSKMNIKFFGY